MSKKRHSLRRDGALIGVDVGSGSVRAGVFQQDDGSLMGPIAKSPIQTWDYGDGFAEQSTDDIWRNVCAVVREAVASAGNPEILGLGFDATCSLVAVGNSVNDKRSVSLDDSTDEIRDVILWMDHRASREAEYINGVGQADVLETVGGAVSLEMEMPKLLWLRKHKGNEWFNSCKFFDLTDYLTWRATGSEKRSLCTLVCKWCFEAKGPKSVPRWRGDFLRTIGIFDTDMEKKAAVAFGSEFGAPGTLAGNLLPIAADALGLKPGLPVAIGAIDAHAGGIGCVGADAGDGVSYIDRLALVGGTSACHMVSSAEPVFTPGVWGPYYTAMIPGAYLNEAGQTSAGQLLDALATRGVLCKEHSAKEPATKRAERLRSRLKQLAANKGLADPALLTANLHVDPDFRGNRSPWADPERRGSLVGLTLPLGDDSEEDHNAVIWLAACQALAYQTRGIIECLRKAKNDPSWIQQIVVSGGLANDPLYLSAHADATGLKVTRARDGEAVVLGAAVLAASAAQIYPDVVTAMSAMTHLTSDDESVLPDPRLKAYHDAKFSVFNELQSKAGSWRNSMDTALQETSSSFC